MVKEPWWSAGCCWGWWGLGTAGLGREGVGGSGGRACERGRPLAEEVPALRKGRGSNRLLCSLQEWAKLESCCLGWMKNRSSTALQQVPATPPQGILTELGSHARHGLGRRCAKLLVLVLLLPLLLHVAQAGHIVERRVQAALGWQGAGAGAGRGAGRRRLGQDLRGCAGWLWGDGVR